MYTKRIVLSIFFLINIFLSSYLYAFDEQKYTHQTEDSDILLYLEAINQIKKNSLKKLSKKEIIMGTIKSFVNEIDSFSDYLSPEEYSAFKTSQKSNYIGIGMEIEKNESGQIVCFPIPGGPAYKAGIRNGNIIKAVNGVEITGASLYLVASKVSGKEGTNVILTIVNGNGVSKKVTVKRKSITSETVVLKWLNNIPVIKIRLFTSATQRKLKDILTNLNKNSPIIIDIRGNPGGDLHGAIDSAMLFLEKNKKIVDIKMLNETTCYEALGNTVNSTSPLYIWQDEKSASSAEVFTAALTQNGRAQSIGKKTYGKGTTQKVIELSDGSALILTIGYLSTPEGIIYHKKGIEPTHSLEKASVKTEDYMALVKKLIQRKSIPGTSLSHEPDKNTKDINDTNKIKFTLEVPMKQKEMIDINFICFDKDFNSEEDAEIWSLVVKKSINNLKNQYIFQQAGSQGVKFILCMGPFETKNDAQKRIDTISELMNIPMFTKTVQYKPTPELPPQ
jgi:carboxyl-terminal processing protease